ncbi:MAG: hypothetical protein WDA68_02305 [Phycisphaerae bacterium]
MQQENRTSFDPTDQIVTERIDSSITEEYKPATLINIFTFPFSGSGIIHLIIFWFTPLILEFFYVASAFCCYGYIFYFAAHILLAGYFVYYINSCIIAAAQDKRFAPDLFLDAAPTCGELLCRFFYILTCLLICFGPLVFYIFCFSIVSQQQNQFFDWQSEYEYVFWSLFGFGIFLFPMLLLSIAMFDSITALNPFLLIRSIIITFFHYIGIVLLCFIVFAGQIRSGILFRSRLLNFFLWGANIYFIFITAYLIGRLFRRYENKLNWEIEL